MSLTRKLNAGAACITKTMKNSVDNFKLEGRIAEQEKIIKDFTKEITNLIMVKLENGETMAPEIMERYEAIQEAKKEIEELEKERKTIKIVCSGCGAKTSVEMNYCGQCGAKLREE